MQCCGTYWFEGVVDRSAPHDALYDYMEKIPRHLTWEPTNGHRPVVFLAEHPMGYVAEFLVAADAESRSLLAFYVERWIAYLERQRWMAEINRDKSLGITPQTGRRA